MDSAVTVRNNATTTGEHYRYAAPFLDAGDDGTSEPEVESGAFYARIHHERELNKSVRLHLFSNAAGLMPGMVLDADGSNLSDLKEGVLITLTTYSAARDSRLHVSVWGITANSSAMAPLKFRVRRCMAHRRPVLKAGRKVTSTPTLIARVKPDVLNFHGREALSAPSEWRIEFTSLRMLSGREVHGG